MTKLFKFGEVIDKYSEFPSMDNFFDLLTKPVLPSDLI